MNKKKYTAIVFFNDGRRPHKYRNCMVKSFSDYAVILGAWYVNFYDPGTKEFTERVYIQKTPAPGQGKKL